MKVTLQLTEETADRFLEVVRLHPCRSGWHFRADGAAGAALTIEGERSYIARGGLLRVLITALVPGVWDESSALYGTPDFYRARAAGWRRGKDALAKLSAEVETSFPEMPWYEDLYSFTAKRAPYSVDAKARAVLRHLVAISRQADLALAETTHWADIALEAMAESQDAALALSRWAGEGLSEEVERLIIHAACPGVREWFREKFKVRSNDLLQGQAPVALRALISASLICFLGGNGREAVHYFAASRLKYIWNRERGEK